MNLFHDLVQVTLRHVAEHLAVLVDPHASLFLHRADEQRAVHADEANVCIHKPCISDAVGPRSRDHPPESEARPPTSLTSVVYSSSWESKYAQLRFFSLRRWRNGRVCV